MRNISFALTTRQFNDRSKTVTRRLGWSFLRAGDKLMGVEKAQGIKKGELVRLHPIEVVSVKKERLAALILHATTGTLKQIIEGAYTESEAIDECRKEGFALMTPRQFVDMFCKHMNCAPDAKVNRIEFKHL